MVTTRDDHVHFQINPGSMNMAKCNKDGDSEMIYTGKTVIVKFYMMHIKYLTSRRFACTIPYKRIHHHTDTCLFQGAA